MFKESIALESLLEIFVAGGLFVIGAWYLHRPFMLETFPAIAPDFILGEAPKLGGKILIFFVLAVISGVFITHMFDAVVPLVIGDGDQGSARSSVRRVATYALRPFIFRTEPDPRVRAIERYLNSPRKAWFVAMVSEWCKSSESKLAERTEMIRVHQHIVSRMRALSEQSNEVLQETYNQVSFAGSIFTSFALLFPVALSSFYTQTLVSKAKTFTDVQLLWISFAIYVAAALSGYSFRRRLRKFYSGVVTLALHFYDEQNRTTVNGTA